MALARLYRGAHFPTDVLGSVLFAVPWLLVMLRLLPVERAPAADRKGVIRSIGPHTCAEDHCH